MTAATHLSTWISCQTKRRFANAAARQSLSESALLKRLVEQMLAGAPSDDLAEPVAPSDSRDARLTGRLVPVDRAFLRERAAARTMHAATYVSALVRSHLRRVAPLPDRERSSLQASVRELTAIGRNLNMMARLLQQDARQAAPGLQEVQAMLRVCEALRDHFDIVTLARRGPAGRVSLSPAQVEQIARTVARAPEVVIKVTRGATSTARALAHLRYIDRNGELDIETDEGEHLKGRGIEKEITADWDLDSTWALGRSPYSTLRVESY